MRSEIFATLLLFWVIPESAGKTFPLAETPRITNDTLIQHGFRPRRFVSLKAAILQYDKIKHITNGAFDGLSKLSLLDLARNELQKLPATAFESVKFLKVLILRENRLREVCEANFAPLSGLVYLDLSLNNITHLPRNFLRHTTSIAYLDVSGNPLKASPGSLLVSDSLAILRLSLYGTRQEISRDFFADLPNLQVLDLSGTDLKVWPERVLRPIAHLRVLYIGVATPLSVDESVFVPSSVEKFVQAEMNVDSDRFVGEILERLEEFDVDSDDLDFLQFLDDFVYTRSKSRKVHDYFTRWKIKTLQKFLLFLFLFYFSSLFVLIVSKFIFYYLRT